MRVTAETKNATRQRILEAARKLFAQDGFDTATTRDIARLAEIATGTLFNYFPTKESIVLCLVSEAHAKATESFSRTSAPPEPELSLEEELFAHVAEGLRKLKPYRKYLPAALETASLPSDGDHACEPTSFRDIHLETVGRIATRQGQHDALTPVAMQLYWTLYAGVLAFWAKDSSRKQEDTLALLDQSLAMFVGWLSGPSESRVAVKKGE